MRIGCLFISRGKEEEKRFLLKNLSVFEGGRATGSHILLKDESVAFCHFRICKNESEYSIYDQGSSKGTLVNGERVEKTILNPGDLIQAGNVQLQFDLVDESTPGQLASSAPVMEEGDDSRSEREPAGGGREKRGKRKGKGKALIPALVVIDGKDKGKTFLLNEKERYKIGRATSSDLKLTDEKISRQHCLVEAVRDHYIIIDLNSSNGTVVNGERIKKTVLKNGDYIRLGFTMMKYDMV